jgi:hypothetical protein
VLREIDPQHERRVRAAVSREYDLPDRTWTYLVDTAQTSGSWGEDVASDARGILAAARALEAAVGRLPNRAVERPVNRVLAPAGEVPAWWSEFSRRDLERWRGRQSVVLQLFGDGSPLTLSEADAAITAALANQVREGRRTMFEWLREVEVGGIECAEEQLEIVYGLPEFGIPWPVVGVTPLAVLADFAADIEGETGCYRSDAVAFLMCDEAFERPWVRAEYRGPGILDMRVGSPVVPAHAVAAAYTDFLDFTRQVTDFWESAPKRRRGPKARTKRLLEFVGNMTLPPVSIEDWREALREWNGLPDIPEKWRFERPETMRKAYNIARKSKGA